MSYEAEFEGICAVMEKALPKALTADEKKTLYEIYRTDEGRQKLINVAAGILSKEAEQTKSRTGFFAKCGTLIVILVTGYMSGVGLFFDGSEWWHHVAFIPLGLGFYLLLTEVPVFLINSVGKLFR